MYVHFSMRLMLSLCGRMIVIHTHTHTVYTYYLNINYFQWCGKSLKGINRHCSKGEDTDLDFILKSNTKEKGWKESDPIMVIHLRNLKELYSIMKRTWQWLTCGWQIKGVPSAEHEHNQISICPPNSIDNEGYSFTHEAHVALKKYESETCIPVAAGATVTLGAEWNVVGHAVCVRGDSYPLAACPLCTEGEQRFIQLLIVIHSVLKQQCI